MSWIWPFWGWILWKSTPCWPFLHWTHMFPLRPTGSRSKKKNSNNNLVTCLSWTFVNLSSILTQSSSSNVTVCSGQGTQHNYLAIGGSVDYITQDKHLHLCSAHACALRQRALKRFHLHNFKAISILLGVFKQHHKINLELMSYLMWNKSTAFIELF